MEKDGWAADTDRLRLFGAGSPVSLEESFPAWGSTSQRKFPTSLPQVTVTEPTGPLGLDKKSCWWGEGRGDSLAAGCLFRLVDKASDSRG